jgi:hypothetical protein
MTDKNYWLVLSLDNGPCGCYIASERYCWILYHADIVTVFLQNLIHALPAGTVHKATMNEDDGFRL